MPPVANPVHISSTPNKRIIVSPSGVHLNDMENLPKYAVGLFENSGPGPRKRKRLTHLTPEEKIMRRKLKNRVAAQTARDRKKAKVDALEESVAKLREQTKQLLLLNARLLNRTEAIEKENNELRTKLGLNENKSNISDEKEALNSISFTFENDVKTYASYSTSSESDDDDDENSKMTNLLAGALKTEKDSISDESWTFDKCGSPVPAAFGERTQERSIPQQQEAVHSLTLIHLPKQQNLQKSILSHAQTQPRETSQKSSTKATKVTLLLKNSSAIPLDLRKK